MFYFLFHARLAEEQGRKGFILILAHRFFNNFFYALHKILIVVLWAEVP
jgi:hypothetical protein